MRHRRKRKGIDAWKVGIDWGAHSLTCIGRINFTAQNKLFALQRFRYFCAFKFRFGFLLVERRTHHSHELVDLLLNVSIHESNEIIFWLCGFMTFLDGYRTRHNNNVPVPVFLISIFAFVQTFYLSSKHISVLQLKYFRKQLN